MTMRHILVATDLAASAGSIYDWAATLASRVDAHVTLLNIDETSAFEWPVGSLEASEQLKAFLSGLARQREERLNTVRQLFLNRGVRATVQTGVGRASERIVQYVQSRPVDAIVVGRRGTRAERSGIGGTVRRLLRKAKVPVLVVPTSNRHEGQSVEPLDHGCIVATTAFTSACLMSLDATLRLARKLGSTVDCVHVIKLPRPFAVASWPEMVPGETREQLEHLHAEDLSAFTGEAAGECRPYTTIGFGVASALADLVLETGIDMIAMPSHSSGEERPPLFGSTTESVVRQSPVPVLVWPMAYLEGMLHRSSSPQ